jgi:hypothetical protein
MNETMYDFMFVNVIVLAAAVASNLEASGHTCEKISC